MNDYNIINGNPIAAETPWETINTNQMAMIDSLKTARSNQDLQNIGNTGRHILQILATEVFDSEKHNNNPENLELSEGKWKNRLKVYIESVANANKEIQKIFAAFVDSALTTADLSNKLTHHLKTHRFIAESCVISVIAVVNLVTVIEKNEIL